MDLVIVLSALVEVCVQAGVMGHMDVRSCQASQLQCSVGRCDFEQFSSHPFRLRQVSLDVLNQAGGRAEIESGRGTSELQPASLSSTKSNCCIVSTTHAPLLNASEGRYKLLGLKQVHIGCFLHVVAVAAQQTLDFATAARAKHASTKLLSRCRTLHLECPP